MRALSKLAITSAIAIIIGSSIGTSAFADSRLREETSRDDRGSYESRDRDLRDHERVTVEGRIRKLTRERDGYRVELEGSRQSFWVPARSVRGRDFRIGISIRLGGIFRQGAVYVDVIEYPSPTYNRVYVRGVVERIDHFRRLMYVRDDFSRRVITIDAGALDARSRRFDLEDFRRGDYVNVYGDWRAHGVLEAYKIELR